ncbi:GFA family protein [Thalassococcus sp. S3]|uniref:GFA family protein n=1 Tax=Thalassococcus sp. S3 TaxID=2017482 RepID=UPI0013EE8D2D|nr:GFA family protein [Thalassococcus sp. S3]
MAGTTEGGCLCGKVRYTLATAPECYGACHCGMCRKFSGGIELGLEVPPGGITWTGEENIGTFSSSEWAERGFCKLCGSSLYWKLTAEGPMQGLLSLSAGSLDSLEGLTFNNEVYVDHMQGDHAFADNDKRNRMTEADVMAMVAAGGEAH